tara:strand:+ start:1474 stop:1941 length:468 start_codon:yes stop_codon:yes gene_type:complete
MTLPTTGPLSINDIRVELGESATNQSLGTFSDTAGFAAPDAISDFYGYSNVTEYPKAYGATTGNVKAAQACNGTNGDTGNANGTLVKGSGNTSTNNFPEVGDTFKNNVGAIINTGALYLPTNISTFGPPPGGLAENIVIQTNALGVITSVYQCTP